MTVVYALKRLLTRINNLLQVRLQQCRYLMFRMHRTRFIATDFLALLKTSSVRVIDSRMPVVYRRAQKLLLLLRIAQLHFLVEMRLHAGIHLLLDPVFALDKRGHLIFIHRALQERIVDAQVSVTGLF